MSRRVECADYQGRWETQEQAQSAIDHILSRGSGKRHGMPRFVIPCGAHFHISSRKHRSGVNAP